MNMNELFAVLVTGNRVQNLLLGLRAKAFDVTHFPGFACCLQFINAGDA